MAFDRPVETVDDIRGAHSFMIHAAVTLIHPRHRIIMDHTGRTPDGDRELCQFAVEFPKFMFPVSEATFRAKFREMEESCIQRARGAGLVQS